MTELEFLRKTNANLLYLMGYSLPLLLSAHWPTEESCNQLQWLVKAIEEVVYKGNDMPGLGDL